MYAVIKTGGKQYRVTPGNVLKVETLDAEVGSTVNFEEVLMIADGDKITVGTPTIASAKVAAEVIAHGRAKKVEIIKFKRRKHHQKRTGHRQNFTQIQIQDINGKGAVAKKATTKAADKKEDTKAKSTKAETKTAPKAKVAAEKKPAANKTPAKKATTKKASTTEDLTKIEGIGPKAAGALNVAGINTFAELSKTKVPAIQKILDDADGKFGAMKPDTWPEQAKLAAADKWDELKKWQDEMDGGIAKK
jgi:large subunit ribosomal protein L21